MPTYQIQTHVHALHVYLVHNPIVYIMPTHASRLYTVLTRVFGVWGCRQVLQQCAGLPPCLRSFCQGCTHIVCARRTIQRTCIACDAQSHTHNSVRGDIHPCMPCTYPYIHSSAQHNSIYHAQTHPTTTHSCEQATNCTHVSFWSVELWARAAAMSCAPSAPMSL
jgi:hypothetical protein